VKLSTKLGLALAGVYLLVVAVAILVNVPARIGPADGGVPTLLPFYLTLPWSLIGSLVLEVVSAGLLGTYLALLILQGVSAAINAVFLYFLGSSLTRRRTRGRDGT
jgi:hypothetical protein